MTTFLFFCNLIAFTIFLLHLANAFHIARKTSDWYAFQAWLVVCMLQVVNVARVFVDNVPAQ